MIHEMQESDLDAVQDFTELAFEPIFKSFARIMGSHIFALAYPDWRSLQRNLVVTLFEDKHINTWIAKVNDIPAGLVAYKVDDESKQGEIDFLVVHPDYQNDGIGTQFNEFALQKLRDAGMTLAIVGTGGDEAHAPARKAYEKAGFIALPSVWYFKNLD